MTLVAGEDAVTITIEPALYRELVRMPHRQYVGLIAKVRSHYRRKLLYGMNPPLGIPPLELALYRMGEGVFTRLREEIKVPRRKWGVEMRHQALLQRRSERAAYMRKYRQRRRRQRA